MTTTIPFKLNLTILSIVIIAVAIFAGGSILLHLVSTPIKDKVASGLLGDFVITFPVLYYFIILRPAKKSIKGLMVIVSLSCLFAYAVLPPHQREYILQIRKLSVFIELAILFYVVSRFRQIRAVYNKHQLHFADPVFNLKLAMVAVLGNSLVVKVLASEMAVWRYGVLFLKKEKTHSEKEVEFSTYKENGYIAIWCVLLFAMLIEMVAFHLLLNKYSHTAATIVTSLTAYGLIFYIADLSAMVKRNTLVTSELIVLRTGLRWRTTTHIKNIASVKKICNDYSSDEEYHKGGSIPSSGNVLIEFIKPVTIEKLYGQSKEITAILMNVDDVEVFINQVTALQ